MLFADDFPISDSEVFGEYITEPFASDFPFAKNDIDDDHVAFPVTVICAPFLKLTDALGEMVSLLLTKPLPAAENEVDALCVALLLAKAEPNAERENAAAHVAIPLLEE